MNLGESYMRLVATQNILLLLLDSLCGSSVYLYLPEHWQVILFIQRVVRLVLNEEVLFVA